MEVTDAMKRRKINVLCVQETKWKGCKAKEIGDFKLYYSGKCGERNGVGIILESDLTSNVIEVTRTTRYKTPNQDGGPGCTRSRTV